MSDVGRTEGWVLLLGLSGLELQSPSLSALSSPKPRNQSLIQDLGEGGGMMALRGQGME